MNTVLPPLATSKLLIRSESICVVRQAVPLLKGLLWGYRRHCTVDYGHVACRHLP